MIKDVDEIHLTGGYDNDSCTIINSVFRILLHKDGKIEFRKGFPLLEERMNHSVLYDKGNIISISSNYFSGCGSIEYFDNIAQESTLLEKIIPDKMHNICAALLENQIFLFGGAIPYEYGWVYTDKIYVLDSNHNWTHYSQLNIVRISAASIVLDGLFYICGGYSFSNSPLQSVEVFDPKTKTSIIETMTKQRIKCSLFIYDGEIYAVGGDVSKESISIEKRNKTTQLWELVSVLEVDRYLCASVLVDSKIYFFGGGYDESSNNRSTFDVYDIKTDLWIMRNQCMPFQIYGSSSILINNPELKHKTWSDFMDFY